MDVAVTIYSTVPAAELLGLVRTWLIEAPEPADAPVMPPVTVPMVQLNELSALAVRERFVFSPAHIASVLGVVTSGLG